MGQTENDTESDKAYACALFAVRQWESVSADGYRITYNTWGVRVLYWRKRAIFPAEFTLQRDIPFYMIHWMLNGG